MTEPQRYEQKVLAMLRLSDTWTYWAFDTRRMGAALRRLIRRGVVRWEVLGFPNWKLVTVDRCRRSAKAGR